MTDAQILAAHRLHVGGMSVSEIARRIWERFGYASHRAADATLRRTFRRRGLWIRPQKEATRRSRLQHGRSSRIDRDVFCEYRREYKRRKRRGGVDSTRCLSLVRTSGKGRRAGERCAKWARPQSDYCSIHDTTRGGR